MTGSPRTCDAPLLFGLSMRAASGAVGLFVTGGFGTTESPRMCGVSLLFGLLIRATSGLIPRRTTSLTGATLLTTSERVTLLDTLSNVYVTMVSVYPFTPGVFTRFSPIGNVGSSSYDTEKSFSTRVLDPLIPFLMTFG